MASSSSIDFPSIHHVIFIRLESDNYPTWLAQIVPVLRSRLLLGFVDGTSLYPFLTTPDPKAKANESASPSLIPNLDDFLCITRGDSFIIDFLDRITSIADNLALAGASVADSDLLVVVMNNIGPLYENTVAVAQAREKSISMPDLEALLLSAERRLQSSSSPIISSGATTLFNKAHAALAPDHSPSSDRPIILSGPSLSSYSPRFPVSQPLPSPLLQQLTLPPPWKLVLPATSRPSLPSPMQHLLLPHFPHHAL
ncbi:hypothetical protein L3X38_022294 [Prunus dulcis]|uniref:Retrotransposon Copia-like N-terminal domain-containing protein n=1 Tax=Prunus dulcis TaxID=3755 RepID=A0AAD4VVR0_PRUDU|nr:hypothetical protein L3X38_022294 [Prunus dulcis]